MFSAVCSGLDVEGSAQVTLGLEMTHLRKKAAQVVAPISLAKAGSSRPSTPLKSRAFSKGMLVRTAAPQAQPQPRASDSTYPSFALDFCGNRGELLSAHDPAGMEAHLFVGDLVCRTPMP